MLTQQQVVNKYGCELLQETYLCDLEFKGSWFPYHAVTNGKYDKFSVVLADGHAVHLYMRTVHAQN